MEAIDRQAEAEAIDREMVAYEAMRETLERDHPWKWVVFHNEELAGVFDTLNEAADSAVRRFGRGPYHIREVCAPTVHTLPASIRFFRPHVEA